MSAIEDEARELAYLDTPWHDDKYADSVSQGYEALDPSWACEEVPDPSLGRFTREEWEAEAGLWLAEAAGTLTMMASEHADGAATVLSIVRDLLRGTLTTDGLTTASEAACIDQIRLLEDIKSAAAGAQVIATEEFRHYRNQTEADAGIPLDQRAKGIGSEVGLARRQSPQLGSSAIRLAHTLTTDMPNALTALCDGRLSEYTAGLVVKETSHLDPAARTAIDRHMATRYGTTGSRRLAGEVRSLAQQADPAAYIKAHQIAKTTRAVSVRPAPSGMAYLTALLPLGQAFACKKTLRDQAATMTISDKMVARSGAQMEADLLVERLTGQTHPDAIPIEIQLIMTTETLLGTTTNPDVTGTMSVSGTATAAGNTATTRGTGSAPTDSTSTVTNLAGAAGSPATVNPNAGAAGAPAAAISGLSGTNPAPVTGMPVVDDTGRQAEDVFTAAWIPSFGPIPATVARDMLDQCHDHGNTARVFLRRILTDPVTGDITAIDTRKREFSGALRKALILRDEQCRTPWCNAPIAHLDHAHPFATGGRTNAANGTGLCARCNYTKEHPGWRHHLTTHNTRVITTPTGHTYTSQPPPLTPNLNRRI